MNGTLGLEVDPSENESANNELEAESGTSEDELENGLEDVSPSKLYKSAKARKASKATRAEYEVTSIYRYVVPVGKETVKAVLKAITHLWEVQVQDKRNPNHFPKPHSSILVCSTRDAYYQKLVQDTVMAWPNHGVYCAQHDGYSVEDFMRMMVKLWKGFETWDQRVSLIRDHMAINLRHQAFFHDESLRIMALSDCFQESLHTTFAGTTTKVHGLAFCLHAGKTQPDFKTDFAMVLRHKEYMHCGVSATAMYLFEHFHVSKK